MEHKRNVSFSYETPEDFAKDLADLRETGQKITKNYNEFADWEIKGCLKHSIQIVNFLDEELKECKKIEQIVQDKQSEIVRLESENTTLKEKDGQRN